MAKVVKVDVSRLTVTAPGEDEITVDLTAGRFERLLDPITRATARPSVRLAVYLEDREVGVAHQIDPTTIGAR